MIRWNRQTQEKYRPQSVQNIAEIKVGDVLYDRGGDAKKIKEIITHEEEYRRLDLRLAGGGGVWIVFEGQNYSESARDLCIGAEYNPWMVFKDEEVAKAYYAELETWYYNNDDYDVADFDDGRYDNDEE